MDDYNALAEYVTLWATCPACEELVSADDFVIADGQAMCDACWFEDCPHGREFARECPLCARGIGSSIPWETAEAIARLVNVDAPSLDELARFIRERRQDN